MKQQNCAMLVAPTGSYNGRQFIFYPLRLTASVVIPTNFQCDPQQCEHRGDGGQNWSPIGFLNGFFNYQYYMYSVLLVIFINVFQ